MNRKIKCLIFASFFAIGCGGGGGGSGSAAKFAGTWLEDLQITQNDCRSEVPADAGPLDVVVNQDGDKIVLDSNSGSTYEGFVTSETSFLVSRSERLNCVNSQSGATLPNSFTNVIRSREYTDVSGDSAVVTLTLELSNCSGNTIVDTSCTRVFSGIAERHE